jgi:hypothetical protein
MKCACLPLYRQSPLTDGARDPHEGDSASVSFD